jgi:hypothetical protein
MIFVGSSFAPLCRAFRQACCDKVSKCPVRIGLAAGPIVVGSSEKVRKISNLKLKMFAALVLRAMARELAEKGTERVSPRDRSVARRLGMEPDSPELAAAERYLVLEDYIRPSSPDHKDGPFIITEFGWKDLGYQLSSEGWRRRPFWKRLIGI